MIVGPIVFEFCLNLSWQVLRRAQLGLRNEEDPDEPPKSKGPGRPKAKAKGKAQAKAKVKGKSRAKTSMAKKTADAAAHPNQEDLPKDEVDEEKDGEEDREAEKGERSKKDDLEVGMGMEQPSAGTREGGTQDYTQAKGRGARKRATKPTNDSKDADLALKEAPLKKIRTSSHGPATFARRPQPSTGLGKAKWHGLRQAFVEVIKPHLVHYSAAEDGRGGGAQSHQNSTSPPTKCWQLLHSCIP